MVIYKVNELNLSIAFIDVLGLPYCGDTLKKRGLGGSESSVILIAPELVKLGFQVTVFNRCGEDDTHPGVYDGVNYINLNGISSCSNIDIIISSRSIAPYTGDPKFNNIIKTAKYKVLWMHDTFVQGSDPFVEHMIVNKRFDKIFTLSDFHSVYVTNCDHGAKRMFEVLKNKIFQTRDGMRRYHDWVNVFAKDPNLFIYNASLTKGMVPLVKDIWPKFIEQVPHAKLVIIGGFYRFPDRQPDDQEKRWHELKALPNNKNITFTGIIKQDEIADLLTKASYYVAPGAFPETFGISALEALNYNTPIIGCRFGAMEETAIDKASYLLDYPVEPNGLFPNINKDEQVNRFLDMMLRAHADKYLWKQKAHYCNIVKPYSQWDSIALQWKQHFYNVLGEYLPVEEYLQVKYINKRIHQIFGRRFANPEDFL